MQCRFCASGRDGLIRNLAAGEILEEFLLGSRRADDTAADDIPAGGTDDSPSGRE